MRYASTRQAVFCYLVKFEPGTYKYLLHSMHPWRFYRFNRIPTYYGDDIRDCLYGKDPFLLQIKYEQIWREKFNKFTSRSSVYDIHDQILWEWHKRLPQIVSQENLTKAERQFTAEYYHQLRLCHQQIEGLGFWAFVKENFQRYSDTAELRVKHNAPFTYMLSTSIYIYRRWRLML